MIIKSIAGTILILFVFTNITFATNIEKKFNKNLPTSNIYSEEIPIPLNNDVMEMIKFFQTKRRDSILKALSRMDIYLESFKKIFREEGLPEILAYLPFIESAYDPMALSNRGARGIWQFMPSTARMYGLTVNQWLDERADPELSCRAAAKYLKFYAKKYDSWTLSVAAYNAGPTRISRAVRRLKTKDFWKIKKSRYIRSQTKRYIPAFIAGIHIAKNPYKYGFIYVRTLPAQFEYVTIPTPTDLKIIAESVGTDINTIKKLNPELRTTVTPFDRKDYRLRIPAGTVAQFNTNYAKIPEDKRLVKKFHKVRRGDTLGRLARVYGTSVREIMSANSIRNARRLRIGQNLIIPLIPGYKGNYNSSNYSQRRKWSSSYSTGQKLSYKVRWGDSLYKIARRYRTDIYSICEWNNINSKDVLKPGARLVLYYNSRFQGKSFTTTELNNMTTYVVRRGDSLYEIARKHKTSVYSLKKLNRLRSSRIYPGDRLRIPVSQ